MPALAQMAGTKNQLINYDFGQKMREELAPGLRIYISQNLDVLFLGTEIWQFCHFQTNISDDQLMQDYLKLLDVYIHC